jgi:putative aldouronate transport system permease protein
MSNPVKAAAPSGSIVDKSLRRTLRQEKLRTAKKMKLLYLLFLIPLLQLIIFRYIPIYGLIIAFKDYRYNLGFWGSPWNNFEHFKILFESPFFGRILRNTIVISLMRIGFGFPAPIILALLINEIRGTAFKRTIQSISYLPHFMSWVVLSGILIEILSPQRGPVGHIFNLLGRPAPNLLISTQFFRPMLIVTGIWQSVGWGTIVYLAALAGIDPFLYESSSVDGANRFQMAIHITIPSLVPVMTVLFILRLGAILNAGFDQILNLYNPLVYEVADVLDTAVYRIGIFQRKYDFGTAMSLFKSAIGVTLIIVSNAVIRRFSEYGVW